MKSVVVKTRGGGLKKSKDKCAKMTAWLEHLSCWCDNNRLTSSPHLSLSLFLPTFSLTPIPRLNQSPNPTHPLPNHTQPIDLKAAKTRVQFAADGSLASVNVNNVEWAKDMGRFGYKTFNDSDWVPFSRQYMNSGQVTPGFAKVGSNNYSESTFFVGQLQAAYQSADGNTVAARLAMPQRTVQVYGAPQTVYLVYSFAAAGNGATATLNITWLNKTPVMIGESIMLLFAPKPARTGPWAIDKMGYPIDPEDVQDGGNQFNHVSWEGAAVPTAQGKFTVKSLDAANINPMTADWPQGNALPAGASG